MASFNKAILIGNLTADPELRMTPNNVAVCRFTIAINRRNSSRNAEAGQQTADFITIVTWRQTAEFVVRYFKKGKPILVCGQIQSRSWTDQQNQKHYATEVVADEVSFVENKGDASNAGAPAANATYTPDAYSNPSFSNNAASASGFEQIQDDEGLPF